jgi:hypothetical protein
MSTTAPRQVKLTLAFFAELPTDPEAADAAGDRIGDEVVATLTERTPLGIYDGSITVDDWSAEADEASMASRNVDE